MKRFSKAVGRIAACIGICVAMGCGSGDDIKDAIDVVDGQPRKTIDVSKLGTNAFVNDATFGTPQEQFLEVRDVLGIKMVRILFNWDDNVQPTPSSPINFSFYDQIVAGLPRGVEALVILTNVPSWMSDPANWTAGNPRRTFVERWVKPVVERYGAQGNIGGFEITNEPNFKGLRENIVLGTETSPENYIEILALASNVVREQAPGKLVVSAATTSINQNFPETINYNESMVNAGALDMVDVYAIHYYGKLYENVVRPGGLDDFMEKMTKPVWVTESGERGVTKQLAYGEEVWPFLLERYSQIERIYQYQFTENTAPDTTYGLRNPSSTGFSDLYLHLKSRASGGN